MLQNWMNCSWIIKCSPAAPEDTGLNQCWQLHLLELISEAVRAQGLMFHNFLNGITKISMSLILAEISKLSVSLWVRNDILHVLRNCPASFRLPSLMWSLMYSIPSFVIPLESLVITPLWFQIPVIWVLSVLVTLSKVLGELHWSLSPVSMFQEFCLMSSWFDFFCVWYYFYNIIPLVLFCSFVFWFLIWELTLLIWCLIF